MNEQLQTEGNADLPFDIRSVPMVEWQPEDQNVDQKFNSGILFELSPKKREVY